MWIIEVNPMASGAHRSQLGIKALPDGWVLVPPELEAEALSYLPFIDLDIQDGVVVGVSQGTRKVSPEETAAELAAAKVERISQSKTDLAAYLAAHPLQWTDGEYYAITAEKQQQLTSKIMSATMAQTMSADYHLTWNSTGEVCKEWTLADLTALAFAIDARVTALVTYQQTQEVAMRSTATMEELDAIEVNYDSVQ